MRDFGTLLGGGATCLELSSGGGGIIRLWGGDVHK